MASMPHFMAQGVNELTASGVEKAVGALMTTLDLSVTAVEEIVLFVINMLKSTYLCLITLAVSGSLHVAVEIGNELVKNLNQTIDEVTDGLGDAVTSITDGIKDFTEKINFPFSDAVIPSINLDDEIKKLKALEVPPQLQQGLQDLNNSIPTFEQVQNFTDNVIRTPFEAVKTLIRGMEGFTFDRQILPVPEKESLTFCSEGNSINEFFDDLIRMEIKARKLALAILIVLAILVCIPIAYSEVRRYRKMQARAALFASGHDPLDVVYLASRPTSSTWGLWLGRRFGSQRRQDVARWFFAYSTSTPMLLLLSLGVAGLFSCLCQWLILKGIQEKVPELTNQVADFAEKIVTALNNASMSWSGGVNGAVGGLDSKINDDIFGWVNTTTSAVNETLNSFVNEMTKTLNGSFGGTVLEEPIQDVLNCLIKLKSASFQQGLFWIQENAHVQFPGVSNETFSLGALAQLSNSSSAAELLANPSGKAKDEVSEAIDHLVQSVISGIRSEALISLGLILVWVLIMTGGLIYAATHLVRRDVEQGTDYIVDPATHNTSKSQAYPNNDALPPYEYPVNKAAPYTLQTRPFPTFEPDGTAEPQIEIVGQVGAHPVAASARPGHLRASSHGTLADPSPSDEKHNPFSDPQQKTNPFRN
jgi:hypothetical protein